MKISRIKVERFKRFHDLTVEEIPQCKLVVITGPNGCGKSSLFDALHIWKGQRSRTAGFNGNDPYFRRGVAAAGSIPTVEFHGDQPQNSDEFKKSVVIRTSYRNEPAFLTNNLSNVGEPADERRFEKLIDTDAAVSKNYTRIASSIIKLATDPNMRALTGGEMQDEFISDSRDAISRLFGGDLELIDIGEPLQGGTFFFKKGNVDRYPYMNLSGGEKSAFDLLLDFSLKKKYFPNAIFCIDEPEAHMSTRLQAKLLGELFDLTGEENQLWVATHSIGMMRKAIELSEQNPGEVTFLDFADHNFDEAVTITPVVPTRAFWRRTLAVALDDLSELVAPSTIVVCEGNPRGAIEGKNVEHDARIYERIFESSTEDAAFVSAGNADSVANDRLAMVSSLNKVLGGTNVIRLIDRDDHSDEDVEAMKQGGLRALSRRHLESYLFDDEVLSALAEKAGHPELSQEAIDAKQRAIASSESRGNASNDMKRASGELVNELRRIFSIRGGGNDAPAFCRTTLAPLIKPGMGVYDELKAAIFGE